MIDLSKMTAVSRDAQAEALAQCGLVSGDVYILDGRQAAIYGVMFDQSGDPIILMRPDPRLEVAIFGVSPNALMGLKTFARINPSI